MNEFKVTADGTRLWFNTVKCPHSDNNACAFCDFDGYYGTKYPEAPWRVTLTERPTA